MHPPAKVHVEHQGHLVTWADVLWASANHARQGHLPRPVREDLHIIRASARTRHSLQTIGGRVKSPTRMHLESQDAFGKRGISWERLNTSTIHAISRRRVPETHPPVCSVPFLNHLVRTGGAQQPRVHIQNCKRSIAIGVVARPDWLLNASQQHLTRIHTQNSLISKYSD